MKKIKHTKHMKKAHSFFWFLAGIVILAGCGKPHEAEHLGNGDSDETGGFKIVKVFQTPGYAQDLVKRDHYLYMAQGEGGLLVVDVADPENPQIVSITTDNVRGYSTKIEVKDSVAYLAAGSFGVTVINILDPNEPFTTVWNLNMKPAKNIHIMGDDLVTAVSEQGVNIASISIPTQPEVRAGLSTTGYAMDVANTNDTAYMLVATGEMGLAMYDISDFQQGYGVYPNVGWCDTPGYAEDVELVDEKSLAYVACGTAGLQIINYADTNNVHIVGSYDASGYAKELVVKNNFVYMTTELSGVQIFDVADETNPMLMGVVDTEFALGIDVDDAYIYVADEDEGLIIIAIPENLK